MTNNTKIILLMKIPYSIYIFHRLEFADVPISNLARESRLVLHVFGRTLNTSETEESKNSNMPMYKEEELGWAAIQFFDYEGLVL